MRHYFLLVIWCLSIVTSSVSEMHRTGTQGIQDAAKYWCIRCLFVILTCRKPSGTSKTKQKPALRRRLVEFFVFNSIRRLKSDFPDTINWADQKVEEHNNFPGYYCSRYDKVIPQRKFAKENSVLGPLKSFILLFSRNVFWDLKICTWNWPL